MNLDMQNQLFIVCGASSGFGKAIAEALLKEGAAIMAVARREESLKLLQEENPGRVEIVCCDITLPEAAGKVLEVVGERQLHGVLVNAGGPPAKTVMETRLEDWDDAYKNILRWKVDLMQQCIQKMMHNQYGRIVSIESASVKQPMENLVLSTAMRLAVVGFVKTLSQEVARQGITLNVLAPGSHDTAALNRLFTKKHEQTGISIAEARQQHINQSPTGSLGKAEDFASLAVWLLSPQSRYITGQTVSIDGGTIRGVMG